MRKNLSKIRFAKGLLSKSRFWAALGKYLVVYKLVNSISRDTSMSFIPNLDSFISEVMHSNKC